jgi:hypothetical protein
MGNLDTTATDLVEAINEVYSVAGGSIDLDDLTDVVLTGPTTGHVVRHNGTNWVNVLGTTYFEVAGAAAAAQSASQPLDSDLTSIAALTTTSYGRAFLALANQAALMALLGTGSETVQGILELATSAETVTGTDTARATHAAGVKAAIDAGIAALVDSAPGLLNTLDEIAAALGDDPNFATTITTALSGKQPLDSDLTAIAALTTTSYGRAFLALADQAALMGLVSAASETVAGKIELATQGEVSSGTDAVRAVTPATLSNFIGPLIAGIGVGNLYDTDISAIEDLDLLYWNNTDGKWEVLSNGHAAPTAYGLSLLAFASGADIANELSSASESASGLIELATQAETNTGTDDARAVTPLKLASHEATVFGTVDTNYAAYYTAAKA